MGFLAGITRLSWEAASNLIKVWWRFSSSLRMEAVLLQRQQQFGADQIVTSCLLNIYLYPYMISWWALQIKVVLLWWLNCYTMLPPNRYPAPLGLRIHPVMSMIRRKVPSGSDHIRSHIDPSCGIYCLRSMDLIQSMESLMVGLSPPCTQKMVSSMMAARERQSKISVQYLQTLSELYFLRHSSQKPQTWVICRHSWFPLIRVIMSGQRTFKAKRRRNVSTLLKPRSTKSPKKRQLTAGISPPFLKSSRRSQNWPWISPHRVTGESTLCTLPSSTRISFALAHRFFTSASVIVSPLLSCSICLSKREGIPKYQILSNHFQSQYLM